MDDLKWLAIVLALGLISLLYIHLLGDAGEEGGA
jgi:hypothetical protein